MVKALLKSKLNDQQWARLRDLKGDSYAFFKRILTGLVRTLPDQWILFIRSHGQIIRRMDYSRHDIYLTVDSSIEFTIRLHSCRKEPETVEWIETFLKEGEVFFDIGANVGAYSLVAAKFFNNNIKVYSFEPSFLNFSQLNKNISINQCQNSITALPIALSDETAIDTFNYSELTSGASLNTLGPELDYKGDPFDPKYTQAVLSFSLDDIIKKFNLPLPNHIKIDVDGTEINILNGAKEVFKNPLLKSVIIEVIENNKQAEKIFKFFEEMNFKVHAKYSAEGVEQTPDTMFFNYIFCRENNCKA